MRQERGEPGVMFTTAGECVRVTVQIEQLLSLAITLADSSALCSLRVCVNCGQRLSGQGNEANKGERHPPPTLPSTPLHPPSHLLSSLSSQCHFTY